MADDKTNTAEKQEFVRRRRPARRAILEVARRILLRDGSEGLTPEAVVKESGFSPEIVYAYFCNKDELLLSIASDELSALSRMAKEDGEAELSDGDAPNIRDLPRMAEGFIAARAATAHAEAEGLEYEEPADASPEAGDEVPGDEPASAQHGETAGDQQIAAGQPAEKTIETLPRDIPRTRRRPNGAREIDGIVKELTGSEQHGDAAIGATVARLERRLYLIERNLAEAAERADADARRAAEGRTFSHEDVAALVARVGNLEKRLADIADDLTAGQKSTLERLRILEATPPAGPSAAEQVPGTQEVPIKFDEPMQDVSPDEPETRGETGLESFLAAARKAAKDAVDESARLEALQAETTLERWKRKTGSMLRRTSRMNRKTLLTTVVPIPLVAIGLAVTVWTAMNAGEVAATTEGLAGTPSTVVAMSMGGAPQITVSPHDELTASARAGNTDAQAELGLNYLNGVGVAADENFALDWLQLAAENGQPVAQYTLATLYAREGSAIHDPATAKYWYQLAAENGNRMAMNNLAMFYAQGLGTDADITEAAHWFSMAAALGFGVAQFNLAVLYERGDGVPHDLVEAYKWYALAAAQGDADAQARIAILAERMDPEMLQEAEIAFEGFEPAPMNPAANNAPSTLRSQG